ncbi:hypothetical protein [Promicromonospora soli]|uniref:Uncharacterized protein n=1 Tax=Promicromonospora soli TaxID=2035533 RepID=A0A919KR60_9MICO|nr:hypothetical protein [Promicromonospora soli]GHH69207.1 hypothetical protein GCM10017772_13810 [Promicromonospora soli]
MSATRRKGSRGGRAASRAGGPPASNALTWAESLAAGDAARGSSALEWAEGLAENDAAPSPWGSVGAAAPADPTPVEEATSSLWGPVPAPVVPGGDGDGDANPWGSVAATEPSVTRGRSKNASGKVSKTRSRGKGAKSGTKGEPKSDPAPTPAGGFPPNPGPVEEDVEALPAPLPDDAPSVLPSKPASKSASKSASKKAAKGPKGRISAPSTAQQRKIKRTLRRGLPKVLDKPMVLVLSGVIAAVLGLGAGWGMSLYRTAGSLPVADAASCAQTQMAWTQAANAQSAMVEDQPETLRKGFINARNALEGVTPPEAIAKDWAVAFTYYSTVANNIEKVKANDGPAVVSAVGGAQQELDTAAMVEASETISLYVNSNCKQ